MKDSLLKRICPYSEVEFIPNRRNQIYADAICRIAHNNEKSRNKRLSKYPINKLVNKNHDILLEIMGDKNVEIFHREYLKGKGFSFQVFTHLISSKADNKNHFAIYNFSYSLYNDTHYQIKKHG